MPLYHTTTLYAVPSHLPYTLTPHFIQNPMLSGLGKYAVVIPNSSAIRETFIIRPRK